jgi:hypothetical protein
LYDSIDSERNLSQRARISLQQAFLIYLVFFLYFPLIFSSWHFFNNATSLQYIHKIINAPKLGIELFCNWGWIEDVRTVFILLYKHFAKIVHTKLAAWRLLVCNLLIDVIFFCRLREEFLVLFGRIRLVLRGLFIIDWRTKMISFWIHFRIAHFWNLI